MKKLFKKFETSMMAVAFAEAGEFETATKIINEEDKCKAGRPTVQQTATGRKVLRAD